MPKNNTIIAQATFRLPFLERLRFLFSGKLTHHLEIETPADYPIKGIESMYGKYSIHFEEEVVVPGYPRFSRCQKKNPSTILSFIVTEPTNEFETKGEILKLSGFGEYCPEASLRGYSLSYLLSCSNHYAPHQLIEEGVLIPEGDLNK